MLLYLSVVTFYAFMVTKGNFIILYLSRKETKYVKITHNIDNKRIMKFLEY